MKENKLKKSSLSISITTAFLEMFHAKPQFLELKQKIISDFSYAV